MRRLLIDIGNSRTKWLIGDGGALDSNFRALSNEALSLSALRELWRQLSPPEEVWISCVGGAALERTAADIAEELWGQRPRVARASERFAGLCNGYIEPRLLGVDRWLNMLGGWRKGRAVCVVSCGTAATIDAVSPDGEHLGGMIIPGLRSMTESLLKHTERVRISPGEVVRAPATLFGKSTGECVASGSLHAIAATAELAKSRLVQCYGLAQAIITGGDAEALLPLINGWQVDPVLVFRGLLRFAEGEETI